MYFSIKTIEGCDNETNLKKFSQTTARAAVNGRSSNEFDEDIC